MTLWAYELVNNQLRESQKENGSCFDFSIRTTVGKDAIKILKDHSLVVKLEIPDKVIPFRQSNVPPENTVSKIGDLRPKKMVKN